MNSIPSFDHSDTLSLQSHISAPPATTHFAPAGRDSSSEFCRKAKILEHSPVLKHALDAVPNMVLLLNGNRQIVSANSSFLTAISVGIDEVTEKRPGEVVGCIRAEGGPDGCGTALHCRTCGAVNAVIDSIETNGQAVRECRILAETPSGVAPLDLKVTATPFIVQNEKFTLAVIEDISNDKRMAVLQRSFFHDVLNTAGCIHGYADYIACDPDPEPEMSQRLLGLSVQLIEEIQYHRDLVHAESGDLKLQPAPLKVCQVLNELRTQYLKHSVAEDRDISINQTCEATIITDRQLLQRVLGNMIKNGLEATAPGNTVTLSCIDSNDNITFTVTNPEVMPEEVQLQIFQRSFSTKAQSGRGIGTYSMKLLGERYLGGQVDFASRPPEGTTFWLMLPK